VRLVCSARSLTHTLSHAGAWRNKESGANTENNSLRSISFAYSSFYTTPLPPLLLAPLTTHADPLSSRNQHPLNIYYRASARAEWDPFCKLLRARKYYNSLFFFWISSERFSSAPKVHCTWKRCYSSEYLIKINEFFFLAAS
jgi:hypothetical protein